MNIIAHRGLWTKTEDKNSKKAFKNALDRKYGIEIDVRDLHDDIVVSHDPPTLNPLHFKDILDYYNKINAKSTIAINIKSDGLHDKLQSILHNYHIENYFTFDMSIPETVKYLKKDIAFYTRISEYDNAPFLSESSGVWIDSFTGQEIPPLEIQKFLDKGKKVCIVSPELHGRDDYEERWNSLKTLKGNISLCTDFPDQCKDFFTNITHS